MQCQESHICSAKGGCTVPEARVTLAVQGEDVQCPNSHNSSTKGRCAVPGESHLQYQGRLYSARRVKSAVLGEGI